MKRVPDVYVIVFSLIILAAVLTWVLPGGHYDRIDVPVQLVDVFAMILGRLGIEVPELAQGAVPPQLDHPILAEVYPLRALSTEGYWRAISGTTNTATTHQPLYTLQ